MKAEDIAVARELIAAGKQSLAPGLSPNGSYEFAVAVRAQIVAISDLLLAMTAPKASAKPERVAEVERAPTDTERLDFLNAQGFTKWVGYGTEKNNKIWPVFPGGDLRTEIVVAGNSMGWERVDEPGRGVRFVSGEKTLGVFYNSKDGLCHLAEYEPYRRPPHEYICGGSGNFSASNETQHDLCWKCFKKETREGG